MPHSRLVDRTASSEIDSSSQLKQFFAQVKTAQRRALLLDYDGTLAPFCADRQHASAYPGVLEILDTLIISGKTKVVLISGRPARQLVELLSGHMVPEIWGSHGFECLKIDGKYEVTKIEDKYSRVFAEIRRLLDGEGLTGVCEHKLSGVAVHWRGLPESHAIEVRNLASRLFLYLAECYELRLLIFCEGLELCLPFMNKGDAVRKVLAELDEKCPVAYLGDDVADEDAFSAIEGRGLSILVRSELRPTAANTWIKPPQELLQFLHRWGRACGDIL